MCMCEDQEVCDLGVEERDERGREEIGKRAR